MAVATTPAAPIVDRSRPVLPKPPAKRCLLGVALYRLVDAAGNTDYHWALVTHPASYASPEANQYDLSAFDLHNRPIGAGHWATKYTRGALADDRAFLGVVHVGAPAFDVGALHGFVREFGPARDGFDTRGLAWCAAAFVVRIVETLLETDAVRLPCPTEELYLRVLERGARLELMRDLGGERVPVIDL